MEIPPPCKLPSATVVVAQGTKLNMNLTAQVQARTLSKTHLGYSRGPNNKISDDKLSTEGDKDESTKED